jgi:hypothetical protein
VSKPLQHGRPVSPMPPLPKGEPLTLRGHVCNTLSLWVVARGSPRAVAVAVACRLPGVGAQLAYHDTAVTSCSSADSAESVTSIKGWYWVSQARHP